MQIRNPTLQELPQLQAIWKICFGDSDRYIEHFFSHNFTQAQILVATSEDTPTAPLVAMMMLIPVKHTVLSNNATGFYVYAVATLPAYRKQGFMSIMHQQAILRAVDAGATFLTLVPATPPLFAMYRKLGYQTCAWHRFSTINVKNFSNDAVQTEINTLPLQSFLSMRQDYLASLSASISLEKKYTQQYLYEQLTLFGGKIFHVSNVVGSGYLVMQVLSDRLIIRETNLSTPAFAGAVGAIARHYAVSELDRNLPFFPKNLQEENSSVKTVAPYGMIRLLTGNAVPDLPSLYMNLMLD